MRERNDSRVSAIITILSRSVKNRAYRVSLRVTVVGATGESPAKQMSGGCGPAGPLPESFGSRPSSALASFCMVATLSTFVPFSQRATADWVVPIRSASSF